MSGVHIVGDAKRYNALLNQWARNGLQQVTQVKPEPGDGAFLRATLGPNGFLVGRFTNDSDLRDSEIQTRYAINPRAEAERAWNILGPLAAMHPEFNTWATDNEPHVGDDKVPLEERRRRMLLVVAYMRHCIDIFNANGHGVTLGNFSRGTPEPDAWPHFYEVWRYALSKNATLPAGRLNILALHGYGSWQTRGPGSLFAEERWHLKRFEMLARPNLPPDLRRAPYVITESGPDHPGGWRVAYGEDEAGMAALAHDWRVYNEWLAATQPGFKGASFFSLGQEGGFPTFDIKESEMAERLAAQHYPRLRAAEQLPAAPPATPAPPTQPTPPQGGSVITQQFIALARAEFGANFEDLRATLPQHPTLRFRAIDSRTMRYLCWHHSATAVNTTWLRIAQAHIAADPARDKEPWAGAGYHVGIRQGKVALLGDLDTQRAHVLGRNHEALGVCVMGDYDTRALDARDLDVMRRLTHVLDALYEPNKELTWHGAMLPNYTSCPGSAIKAVVPTLRAVAPPAPGYTREDAGKASWFAERLADSLDGDMAARAALIGALTNEPPRPGAHNALVAVALPALYAARDK